MNTNNFNNVPRQTIYYWINNWNIPNIEYECFDNVKNLYVMVDEKYIHEQTRKYLLNDEEKNKKHHIMSKCFVTFTGAKLKNNRKVLLNKHHFLTASKTPWKDFADQIHDIYNFEEIENIHLLSDADSWILAGKNEIKFYKNNNIEVDTCEFHVKQKINRSTTDKGLRNALYMLIYELENKEGFSLLMNQIIENKDKETRKKKVTEYKNYILKHWKNIINMKYSDIKSSMEPHISHCVANHFGSRPKGYSIKNIEKYLKLQEALLNNINIMDLYLKSLSMEDNQMYNKKEISYSVFEPPISSNIPRGLYNALNY